MISADNVSRIAEAPFRLLGWVGAGGRPQLSAVAAFESTVSNGLRAVLARGAEIQEGTAGVAIGFVPQTGTLLRVAGRYTETGSDGPQLDVTSDDVRVSTANDRWAFRSDASEPAHRITTALDRAQGALLADADLFVVVRAVAGELVLSVTFSGTALVAHETNVLLVDRSEAEDSAEWPVTGIGLNLREGVAVGFEGAATRLVDSHHVSRFFGARAVLSLTVNRASQLDGFGPRFDRVGAHSDFVAPASLVAASPPVGGEILSVNVSLPRETTRDGQTVSTGIFKRPVPSQARLRWLNFDADGQADLWGHGGAFRAVYVYSNDHYFYWQEALGRDDLSPGQFGENLTVSGMSDNEVFVGDVYRLGTAVVEVSQPRVPCFKLALKMGIDGFQDRFRRSGRVGFYLRVRQQGEVGAGDRFELLGRDPNGMSVRAVNDLLYFSTSDLAGTRRALSIAALSHGWKESFEERLRNAKTASKGLREVEVSKIVRESDVITSFYLEPTGDVPLPEFRPGQFLTVYVPGPDGTVVRTYSLSDRPGASYYRLSIKREASFDGVSPPGVASTYFHDRIRVGDRLAVLTPRGRFSLTEHPTRGVVLLSAGVGLTPMISMLNRLAGSSRPVWFIHGARNGREHAFGDHVRRLAAEHSNVNVHVRYSAPEAGDQLGVTHDSVGRVNVALIKSILPFDSYDFYLVGPPPFMRDVYGGLVDLGIDGSRMHYEFFGPSSPLVDAAKPAIDTSSGGGLPVRFARADLEATWDAGSLLELAEAEGLSPPFSCRSGVCQTCACRVVEGSVTYDEDPVQPPDDGYALICVARPRTNVVLDL